MHRLKYVLFIQYLIKETSPSTLEVLKSLFRSFRDLWNGFWSISAFEVWHNQKANVPCIHTAIDFIGAQEASMALMASQLRSIGLWETTIISYYNHYNYTEIAECWCFDAMKSALAPDRNGVSLEHDYIIIMIIHWSQLSWLGLKIETSNILFRYNTKIKIFIKYTQEMIIYSSLTYIHIHNYYDW